MGKIAKEQRRAVRRVVRGWRQSIADGAPDWARASLGPVVNYADMLMVDHGLFRLAYLNLHRLGRNAWRSAQPAPHQIAAIKRLGVRTIVNLRGERYSGSYWLEQAACARHGIRLVDYQLRSRAAPTRAELRGARDVLRDAEYPILLHCKSGADRAGFFSVLYRHIRLGEPIEDAAQELHWFYGHFKSAKTGVLDHFFRTYLAERRPHQSFLSWVEHDYNKARVQASFKPVGSMAWLVDKVLRRE